MATWIGVVSLIFAAIQTAVLLLDYSRREPSTMKTRTAPVLMVAALSALTWGAVGFDYFYVAKWNESTRPVWNKSFSNETVPLDGIEYVDSTFDGVTFDYEGTRATRITRGKFLSHGGDYGLKFRSSNPVVNQTAEFLTMLHDLAPDSMKTVTCEAPSS